MKSFILNRKHYVFDRFLYNLLLGNLLFFTVILIHIDMIRNPILKEKMLCSNQEKVYLTTLKLLYTLKH